MMNLKARKRIRLENYDYACNGAYFITICTENRRNVLGRVGAENAMTSRVRLTHAGQIVEQDYFAYRNYIEGNPSKWAEDKYFA